MLKRLGNRLKRDFIDIDESSFDDFENFINNHKKFIAKIKTGGCGIRMKIYDLEKKPVRILKLFSVLKKNKTCLLEEYIEQCELLNKIYPKVVSTVRIYTLKINGSTELISYPLIRIPTSSAGIRNEDTVVIKIDPITGECPYYCILVKNGKKRIVKNYIHPYSKIPLSNFKVPFFEEIKQLALDTAKDNWYKSYIGYNIITNEFKKISN